MFDQSANAPGKLRPLSCNGDSARQSAGSEGCLGICANSISKLSPLLQFRKRDLCPGSPHFCQLCYPVLDNSVLEVLTLTSLGRNTFLSTNILITENCGRLRFEDCWWY